MHPYLFLKLLSCVCAAALCAGIIARDPRLKINWLMGMLPACAAFWAFCEIAWNFQSDPDTALTIMRLSSLGWLMLAPVCLHIFVELPENHRSRLRLLVPWAYGFALVGVVFYNANSQCLIDPRRVAWGWDPVLGPLFPAVYGLATWPALVVTANWWRIHPRAGSTGERRVAVAVYGAVVGVLILASVNEVLLPLMGHPVPRYGSDSMTLVSLLVGWHLLRYGHLLLSPGGFSREIIGSLPDGVALLFADGRIREVNEALVRLAGAPAHRLEDQRVSDLFPRLEDELADGGRSVETALVTASYGDLPVEVTPARLPSIESGAPLLGDALIVSDIREVTALRDHLLDRARLAAVGELKTGISEALHQPMAVVATQLDQLGRHWQEIASDSEKCERLEELLAEGEELIHECLEGVDRIGAILRDVRSISTESGKLRGMESLGEIVESSVRVVEGRRGREVEIETDLAEAPEIPCSPGEIEQVVVNLLSNALHAVGSDGSVRVVVRTDGDCALLQVVDNGCGIPAAIRGRIFDPFFTSKPMGEGTGLGLPICLRLVLLHDGKIDFESREGAGTTFNVRLPLSPDP